MKDGRIPRLLPLEFFVETEDGPLAGLVHVPDATAAGCEVAGRRCGERSQGGGTGGRGGRGDRAGVNVLVVAGATAAGVEVGG